MAGSSNRNELIFDDEIFEYRMQILGEDGCAKQVSENGLVFMEDVECYSILLRQRRKADTEYIPCATISIDGKPVGLFAIRDNELRVDRFPSNGDIMAFVACKNQEVKCDQRRSQSPFSNGPTAEAFGNVTPDNMGLIQVKFGICRDTPWNNANAYFEMERYVPEALTISSRDVKPLLESLDLHSRKRDFDEPDCGARTNASIEGGTLRFGNDNMDKMVHHMFQVSAVTQFDTGNLAVRLVGTLESRNRLINKKNVKAKGILGNLLKSDTCSMNQLPPRADVTY